MSKQSYSLQNQFGGYNVMQLWCVLLQLSCVYTVMLWCVLLQLSCVYTVMCFLLYLLGKWTYLHENFTKRSSLNVHLTYVKITERVNKYSLVSMS